jgi:hypothetical protein
MKAFKIVQLRAKEVCPFLNFPGSIAAIYCMHGSFDDAVINS